MSNKKKIQLPTKSPNKTSTKADPTASDAFTQKGSRVVEKNVTATKPINLVIAVPMIEAIDQARQAQPPKRYKKQTRTAWIAEAIAEKLERENS